jgi:SAM-dependent methyltransferase
MCQVYDCEEDDFTFAMPFVGGSEEFYNIIHAYKRDPAWRWDYDFALENLDKAQTHVNVLDIGAGEGRFLTSLPATWRRYAVERSEQTRRMLAAKGVLVMESLETLCESMPEQFSVITLFQVLEHVGDPRSLMALCRRLIAPGGRLILSAPERHRNSALRDLVGYRDIPPAHVSWWSEKSLAKALTSGSFRPMLYQYSPNSWAEFQSALYYRLVAAATDENSLAARCYSVRPRQLRNLALFLWLASVFPTMLPQFAALRRGRTIAVVAEAV